MTTDDVVPSPEVRAAWSKEIARRMAEIDLGEVELVDWEDVRAELYRDE